MNLLRSTSFALASSVLETIVRTLSILAGVIIRNGQNGTMKSVLGVSYRFGPSHVNDGLRIFRVIHLRGLISAVLLNNVIRTLQLWYVKTFGEKFLLRQNKILKGKERKRLKKKRMERRRKKR